MHTVIFYLNDQWFLCLVMIVVHESMLSRVIKQSTVLRKNHPGPAHPLLSQHLLHVGPLTRSDYDVELNLVTLKVN